MNFLENYTHSFVKGMRLGIYFAKDAKITLVNTNEIKTVEEYIKQMNETRKKYANIRIERDSLYDNNTKGISIFTLSGEKNLKIVSFYEFDLKTHEILTINDYWFQIF